MTSMVVIGNAQICIIKKTFLIKTMIVEQKCNIIDTKNCIFAIKNIVIVSQKHMGLFKRLHSGSPFPSVAM